MMERNLGHDLPPTTWNVPTPMVHLKYFHEVATCGSIRMAAEHLRVAPSAISRQIKKLEEQIGFPLFERLPRGVSLTSAGEVFARYARDSLLSLDRVRSELDEIRNLQRGHIRLHTIEGLVADFIAPAIGEFVDQYPNVTFDLFITGTEQIATGLSNGDADIGFAFNLAPQNEITKAFSVRDPVLAAMAPDYPLASLDNVTLRELAKHPIAIPERRFGMRYLIDVACRDNDIELRQSLETNSLEAMRTFARRGAGVSFLHALSITQDIRNGTLVTVPITAKALLRGSVDACILASQPLNISAEKFLVHADNRLRGLAEIFR